MRAMMMNKNTTPLKQMKEKKDHYYTFDRKNALSPITLLSRIRTVTMDSTGTIFCSCKNFERLGLPCVHQASVASLCHDHHINTETGVKDLFSVLRIMIYQYVGGHNICITHTDQCHLPSLSNISTVWQ